MSAGSKKDEYFSARKEGSFSAKRDEPIYRSIDASSPQRNLDYNVVTTTKTTSYTTGSANRYGDGFLKVEEKKKDLDTSFTTSSDDSETESEMDSKFRRL